MQAARAAAQRARQEAQAAKRAAKQGSLLCSYVTFLNFISFGQTTHSHSQSSGACSASSDVERHRSVSGRQRHADSRSDRGRHCFGSHRSIDGRHTWRWQHRVVCSTEWHCGTCCPECGRFYFSCIVVFVDVCVL